MEDNKKVTDYGKIRRVKRCSDWNDIDHFDKGETSHALGNAPRYATRYGHGGSNEKYAPGTPGYDEKHAAWYDAGGNDATWYGNAPSP